MDIHFGVDYYPEHWSRDRWETDVRLMEEMGIQVVRLAEFSWHKLEPAEGSYDF
ncbi:MAG: beta-galactosidase, partial [Lachnospiraceae bacterium]|nr:beta-galactosidase [Lachnospiraceae bacterium]